MASNASALLLLHLLPFLLLSLSSAFNITKILEQYPDLSGFNSLLSQTKLADQINGRSTITVLAVDGGGLGAASGLPEDVLKRVLSVHVILDYYDTTKLQNLKSKSISLTTLFQTTGNADMRQGFLNMTKAADGKIAFGSAMPGSPITSNLVKSIMSRPYNISVLQVSAVIVPPGITDLNPNKTNSPPPSPSKTAPAPAPSKDKKPATPPSEAPEADDSAATPADAPAKDDPASPPADTPAADAPSADAPAADSPKGDDSSADQASGAGQAAVGAGAGVAMMMMGALLWGL